MRCSSPFCERVDWLADYVSEQNLLPRLEIVEEVWRGARACLFEGEADARGKKRKEKDRDRNENELGKEGGIRSEG